MKLGRKLVYALLDGTLTLVVIVLVLTMLGLPVPIVRDLPIPVLSTVLKPSRFVLSVPFTPQAPDGDWAEPWQNACEETDIVIVDHFYRKDPLTSDKAKTDILRILSVKEQRFGVSKNESMDRVVQIINAAGLSWQGRVVINPTIQALQKEIEHGRPVIVPVDARLLTNPYYANVMPEYHTLVLSGYDSKTKQFIVQDSGTDKGANFTYGYAELMKAMHDLVAPDIRQGRKAVIFTQHR